jgi:uncharacterized protein (DUF1697 family)
VSRTPTTYIALLRAINVGGTGKLSMADLRALCHAAGFTRARTYIQSGNVLFESQLGEAKVKATLEQALSAKLGKPHAALVRTGAELDEAIAKNPFKLAQPNQVLVLFLDEAPAPSALAKLVIPGREEVKLAGREVFIHFPDGMGRSKLKLPFSATATGRNMNTVVKLAALAREMATDSGAQSGD